MRSICLDVVMGIPLYSCVHSDQPHPQGELVPLPCPRLSKQRPG